MIQFALTSLIFLGFQILLVLGLNVQFGLTGILNLAFIIFYAAGAYTAGVMTAPPPAPPGLTYIGGWSLPFYWGIAGAVVVAGILSALVGGLALSRRLRGSYTAITTLVVAVVALQVVSQSQGLFDGSLGLLGVPLPFGRGLSSSAFAYLYTAFVFAVVVVCALACGWLRRSPYGRILRLIREDEVAAEVFGYNVVKFKLSAFVIGGMLAGLSGCLTIYYVGSFSPGGWGVGETLFTLTCIFVGGAGNTIGVIVGASVISLIFVQLTSLLPTLQSDPSLILVARGMLIPLLLILVLRFRPAGLIPERLPRLPIGKPRSGPGRDGEDLGLAAGGSAAAIPSAQPPGAGRGPGR
jgi:branched-chain amino acid transport system permease protein